MQLAEYYSSVLKTHAVNSTILDLSTLPDDFLFTPQYENAGKNPTFNKFQQQVDDHEKLVFIVAEYNGSFPGVLKAFIDGLDYPDTLKDKKAALVGISAGDQGGALALSHLSDILSFLGTHVHAFRPRLSSLEKNFRDGKFINKLYADLIEEQAKSLITF